MARVDLSLFLEPADVVRLCGGAVYPAVQRRRLKEKKIAYIEDGSIHRRPLVLRALVEKMGGLEVVVATVAPPAPDFSMFPKVA